MARSLKAVSPKRIDALCANYKALKRVEETAKSNTAAVAAELLLLLAKHGQPKAEKSLALTGEEFEAVRTDGVKVEINADVANELSRMLRRARIGRRFTDLFQVDTRFTLSPRYEENLAELLKHPNCPKDLLATFHAAISHTPKSPSLSVRELKKKAKEAIA